MGTLNEDSTTKVDCTPKGSTAGRTKETTAATVSENKETSVDGQPKGSPAG